MSCDKRTYASLRAAQAAALRSSRLAGIPLRVYGCKACHGFHLTKKVTLLR